MIWDLLALILYFAGLWSLREKGLKKHPEERYFAGYNLTQSQGLFSLLGTEVSALTFIGLPAFAFAADLSFIGIYIGAIFARIIIIKKVLPYYWRKGPTTYSILSEGHSGLQKTLSLIFMIGKILSVGVRFYSGTILVSEFFKIPASVAILLISGITYAYVARGGLKVIAQTDKWQTILLVSCGLIFYFIFPSLTELNLASVWEQASDAGKLEVLNQNFFLGILGGFFLDLFSHGVDQDYVQRLFALPNLKSAQKVLAISCFFSLFIGVLFLGIGPLLWVFAQHNGLAATAPDRIFANFIVKLFPPGARGLMMAGVLAATMSTLDSTINAISSSIYYDLAKQTTNKKTQIWIDLFPALAILFAALAATQSSQLLILGLKIQTWVGGAFLALLFFRLIDRKAQQKINAASFLCAFVVALGTVWISHVAYQLSWHINLLTSTLAATTSLVLWSQWKRRFADPPV